MRFPGCCEIAPYPTTRLRCTSTLICIGPDPSCAPYSTDMSVRERPEAPLATNTTVDTSNKK